MYRNQIRWKVRAAAIETEAEGRALFTQEQKWGRDRDDCLNKAVKLFN